MSLPQSQSNHEKYEMMFQILSDMNYETDLESALNIFTKRSIDLLSTTMSGIWLWEMNSFKRLSASGESSEYRNFLLTFPFPTSPVLIETLFNILNYKNQKLIIEDILNPEESETGQNTYFRSWHGSLRSLGIVQLVCVPLMHFGQLLGIYAFFNKFKVSGQDLDWLEHFIPLISSFVYEQQMREAAFEREQALTLLLRGTEILVQVDSEENLLQEAGEMAMEILYIEAGVFVFREGDTLNFKAPFGRLRQINESWQEILERLCLQNGYGSNSLSRTAYFIELKDTDIDVRNESMIQNAFQQWERIFVQPLQTHSGIIGELWLMNSCDQWMEERQEILTAFVRVLGISLETIRQRHELERLALTDRLTGIFNRQGFEQRIKEEMASALRRKASLLFLILDLDGFKKLNDTYGHPAGDAALQAIARQLKASVRPYDLVARSGGDEFVVVFIDLDKTEEGVHTVERLKANLNLENYNLDVTIGAAEFPGEAMDYEGLYRLADQRLYHGKYHGKSQIVWE